VKKQSVSHVFIVSFDGGKPSVMQLSAMPTLMQLVREGACTWEAKTIMPSVTLPSHASMLTGVEPTKHGLLWNDWQPERGMVKVPTIFALAKKQKLKTAMFVGKSKFLHLFVPGSVGEFSYPAYSAKTVARLAAEHVLAERPNLTFVHFADSDGAGHDHGWGSPQQKRSFADEDDALKTLLDAARRAGILPKSVFLLTADHGGHDRTHGLDIPDDRNIPWIAWGKGIARGKALTTPISTCDTAATALHLLGVALPANLDGKPITEALA
jgi:predicted AlkP superfamily pyrophosphatase or phosphodiesterase